MMRFLAVLAVAVALLAGHVSAADSTKIVVPYAPAGTADLMARLIAPYLQERLGDTVIIENRGGGSGVLGNEQVARAPADGKTLLLANMASHVLGPALHPPRTYEQDKAFEPLVMIGSVPLLLAIRPDIPASNLKELIAWGKTAPKLAYGSAGAGTAMHIAGEMLNQAGGLKAMHVPYRGAAPAINGVLGGHLDFLIADVTILLPQVQSGKLRAIALYAPKRSPLLPDVPTANEAGFPVLTMENWYGVFAPAGLPGEVATTLEKNLLEILALPDVKKQLDAAGMDGTRGRVGFKTVLAKDFAYWGPAIKKYRIAAETTGSVRKKGSKKAKADSHGQRQPQNPRKIQEKSK
jgi:tripartite-type tricarboxylate transporter receptor subunit TctC